MSSCFRSWRCSGSNVLKPPLVDQHQLTLTGSHGTGPPPLSPLPPDSDFRFRRQFQARLNNSWRTALFIKWYAVLINVVEACFAIYEIAVRDRRRYQGRSRRNLHLAMATLMLLSNGAAIVGLLTANPTLLAPYYYLHGATLVLELNYVVTRAATAGWTVGSKSTRQSSTVLSSLATLVYITFNLLIMIEAEFGTGKTSAGSSTTRWFSVPDWIPG